MDIDCYRLAYNTFFRNWRRFGVPEEDIPFAKTEKVESLDLIIPGFSKAAVLFQIASRSELKTFFDESWQVHNRRDFYTRFENTMKKIFPKPFIIVKDLPTDALMEDFSEKTAMKDASEDTMKDESSENTAETCLSEDNTEEDLSEGSKKGSLSEDSKKESLPEDSKKESLPEDSKKESLPENSKKESLPEDSKKENLPEDDENHDNKIKPEEVPALIAFSLAICTELILYQYENNKMYMEYLLDIWVKYFNENLKDLCVEAGCTLENLRAYSESIRFPENVLNKFISENKNEYHNIEEKFRDYVTKNYAGDSSDGCKFQTETASFHKGLSFRKVKAQFRAILESCKSTKAFTAEEIPLLDDYSPCTPTSP